MSESKSPLPTDAETAEVQRYCEVQRYWKFEESPAVIEYKMQLREGLISSVEFAEAILALWGEGQKS